MIFALAIDLQFYFQVKNYKPVAFIDLPHPAARPIGYVFAVVSILATFAGAACLYMTLAEPFQFKTLVIYDILMTKAIFWAPWVGWEYYDMLFEHLYYDAQYQLNQMIPGDDFMGS